jgi:hypothetical protein
MKPVPSEIEKEYPPRGPLHQFRFKQATAFNCFRCGNSKVSKLITVYAEDWNRRLCNGCYGRLLSIYEVQRGTATDDEKCSALAELLLSIASLDKLRECQSLFKLSENRSNHLSEKSLRFVATSEHVSKLLQGVSNLDWSPAIIGLCKAVETEVVGRLLLPLATCVAAINLDDDMADKDFGKIAKFCKSPSTKSPELGTFAHFLQTAINSESRRQSSQLLKSFFELTRAWPRSNWLLTADGLHEAIVKLTKDFRNKAAHTDELCSNDYLACREYVIGEQGVLWQLILATQKRN